MMAMALRCSREVDAGVVRPANDRAERIWSRNCPMDVAERARVPYSEGKSTSEAH